LKTGNCNKIALRLQKDKVSVLGIHLTKIISNEMSCELFNIGKRDHQEYAIKIKLQKPLESLIETKGWPNKQRHKEPKHKTSISDRHA